MSSAYVPAELRERVRREARYRCGYCLTQEAVVGTAMEVDHVFPYSLGGPTTEENLWLVCSCCNKSKGNRLFVRDAESGRTVPIFNPRSQGWEEHFQWTESGVQIAGTTDVGRATVEALSLNRPLLVRARGLWVAAGWHPPED